MQLEKAVLGLYIAAFMAFGFIGLFATDLFADALKFNLDASGARMEFIAAYGGLMIGIGLFLIYCFANNVRAGLVAVLAIVGALLLGRLFGLAVDQGSTRVQDFFIVIETLTVLLVGYVVYQGKSLAASTVQ